MKEIKVLGPGCAKCSALYEKVKEIADATGLEYNLEKITDMNEIISFGVMITPGLVVDGQVVASGKVPKDNDIKKMIQ